MKRKDILRLHNAICSVEQRQFNVKFSYFLAKNKVAIKEEIEAIKEIERPSQDYIVYDSNRAKLAQNFADKNPNGTPVIKDNNFVITEKMEEFEEELKKLKEKNKDIIEANEKRIKELEDFLDEKIDFNKTKIDFKDVPPNIEPVIMEILINSDLVNEPEEK